MVAHKSLLSPARTTSRIYLGHVDDMHAADRTAWWQGRWQAFKIALSTIFFSYFMVQVVAVMFIAGCNHNACVIPDWWPKWLIYGAEFFLSYLVAIAASSR